MAKKQERAKKHPVVEAAEFGEQDAREHFREVSLLVRYQDFADYPWERFRALKRLAMLDLWTDVPEERKAAETALEPEQLKIAREGELYARLVFALTEAFREASAPKSAEQWVKAMEDASFRRLARIARHAIDPRHAAAAARDFADRAAPKVSRNADQGAQAPVLMITEDGAKLLLAAMETVHRKSLPPAAAE